MGVEQPFLAIDVGHEGHVQRSPQETANVEPMFAQTVSTGIVDWRRQQRNLAIKRTDVYCQPKLWQATVALCSRHLAGRPVYTAVGHGRSLHLLYAHERTQNFRLSEPPFESGGSS